MSAATAKRAIAAIAQPEHDQRVGEPGDAKPDAPRAMRVLGLLRQRKLRRVDHIVEQAHGDAAPLRRGAR